MKTNGFWSLVDSPHKVNYLLSKIDKHFQITSCDGGEYCWWRELGGTMEVIFSPKESSLFIVCLLGLSCSLFLGLLVFDFYQPTNHDLYWVGRGGGGAYFWVKFWLFSKLFGGCLTSIWALFKASKAYFCVYSQLLMLINGPKIKIFDQKYAHLCGFMG